MADDERLFEQIGPELSDEEKIARLIGGWNCYWSPPKGWPDGVDYESPELSPEDETIVRSSLADQAADVRKEAASILGSLGPVTWEDLRAWLLDPSKDVRDTARMDAELPGASGRLCNTDRDRCAMLLADSWSAYPTDGGVSVTLRMQGMHEEGWLEPTWRAAESLLDLGNEDIVSRLRCGYFEDMVKHFGMGPDDPHIRPWIEGSSRTRKDILLAIASWLQMRDDNLCAIVAALRDDPDAEVAQCAREMLAWKAAQTN